MERLTVAWQLSDPPVAPTRWQRLEALPVPAPGDEALELAFAWPPKTLAALRLGFQRQLSRTVGWESSKASADVAALRRAATVFKRGVAFRTEGDVGHAASAKGQYDIRFLNAEEVLRFAQDDWRTEFTIIDGNVAKAWPECKPSSSHILLTLTEHTKTLESVANIIAAWQAAGRPLAWTIIGGGLLSDVAQFAAALVQARAKLVPTTLLAMADASVGGKTGVNFSPYGKNQVGAFYNPESVTIWPGWLKTLPPRELRAGGIECLKHAFLAGTQGMALELAVALAAGDLATIGKLLPDVVRIKASVVADDPGETARRATLNLGHTFAHALEHWSQTKTTGETTLLHGEAVGVGLVMALILSHRFGGLRQDAYDGMLAVLKNSKCLLDPATLTRALGGKILGSPELFEPLLQVVRNDKKAESGDPATQWVLLADWGKCARDERGGWTRSVFTAELKHAYADLGHAYERVAPQR